MKEFLGKMKDSTPVGLTAIPELDPTWCYCEEASVVSTPRSKSSWRAERPGAWRKKRNRPITDSETDSDDEFDMPDFDGLKMPNIQIDNIEDSNYGDKNV
jgi:hypothetical protein